VSEALGIQDAMRMCRIILSSVVCPAVSYISHYFINATFSKKKKNVIEHKKRVLISSKLLSETFLILRRIRQDMIRYVYWSPCNVPVILVRF